MGFLNDSVRLIKIAKKPSLKEIWLISKVTIVGMSILGLIGFIIYVVGRLIFESIR
ncbi:MAG: Protein translocase subunit SecE [Candidatus Heimdallarchaeota archaeon LC_3]|nr:MAG: Protein translocase subunit SecE [Candidatus Heimdallarchaeota archaeon LC_3]